jgi:hypothetical protein
VAARETGAGQAGQDGEQTRASVEERVRDPDRPRSRDHEKRDRRREYQRKRVTRAAERAEERQLQRSGLHDRQ